MRKVLSLGIAVLFSVLVVNTTQAFAATLYVSSDTLNVREQPSTDSAIVRTLNFNDSVETVSQVDGWYKLSDGAFVNASYLVDKPYRLLCEKDGAVADKYCYEIDRELSVLPDSLLNLFVDNGWKVYVTDKNIASTFFNGKYNSVRGVASYTNKAVYFEDRDPAMGCALHEFGHSFDFINGRITQYPDFQSIYAAEQATFHEAYGVTYHWDDYELFAQGFQEYFLSREKLAATCPQLYEFIDSYVRGYLDGTAIFKPPIFKVIEANRQQAETGSFVKISADDFALATGVSLYAYREEHLVMPCDVTSWFDQYAQDNGYPLIKQITDYTTFFGSDAYVYDFTVELSDEYLSIISAS